MTIGRTAPTSAYPFESPARRTRLHRSPLSSAATRPIRAPGGRFAGHADAIRPDPPDPSAARWDTHYWCAGFDEGENLDDRVRAIARLLSEKKDAITAIVADGGSMDVYAFVSPVRCLGIVMEPDLVMMLASSGVALGIEIYLEKWQRATRGED